MKRVELVVGCLMVLAVSGAPRAAALEGGGNSVAGIKVSISLYSGRPNPFWLENSPDGVAQIKALLTAGEPVAEPAWLTRSKLDYSGFLLSGDGLPGYFRVFEGVIAYQKDGKHLYCKDTTGIEDYLLSEAQIRDVPDSTKTRLSKFQNSLPGLRLRLAYVAPASNDAHRIEVTAPEQSALGKNPVRFKYKNASTQDWTITDPLTSSDFLVRLYKVGGPPNEITASPAAPFWSYSRDGKLLKTYIRPTAKPVVIKPGDEREFTVDMYSLGLDWVSGDYELWLRDEKEHLFSSTVKLKLTVAPDSVLELGEMAAATPVQGVSTESHQFEMRRDFAIAWLVSNIPGANFNAYTRRDDTGVVAAKDAQNRRAADSLKQSWPTFRDTPMAQALLKNLNERR